MEIVFIICVICEICGCVFLFDMRILHTEWSDGLGGQEKRILAEAVGLSGRGHYVALACREHAWIKNEALKLGLDVHVFPMKKMYDIHSLWMLTGFLKKNRYDVVSTHSGVDSWIGGLAAKIANVPVLVRTRHLNIPLKRSLLNFIHYLPDMYISCGKNMRSNLVNNCGFPEEKVVSIPTGVSSDFFSVNKNSDLKSRYGLDKNAPVITNSGIFRAVKGHEITLRSVGKVIEKFPKAKFLLVGDGPDRKLLEDMAGDLGISDHVIFTGFIEHVSEIYSFTDVAILSSWSEGLPQSLLQAMSAGVPVVSTKVGGVPEIIIHEKTGLLVEPGDDGALAQGIIRMLSDTDLAAECSKRAKDLVKHEHSLDTMIDKIEGLYRELLNSKNRSPE
jgi:glycosyltransferase involved in cell wall biosynthesis